MSKSLTFIASLLTFNQLTPGRVLSALKSVREAAEPDERAVLEPWIDDAIQLARRLTRMRLLWRAQRTLRSQGSGRTGIQAVDGRVDGVLGSVVGLLERAAQYLPAAHPARTLAAELLEAHFPDGLGAVTSLQYEDELAAAEDLLEALFLDQYAPLVRDLGLGVWREVLQTLLPEYEANIGHRKGKGLAWSEVQALRLAVDEALGRVVAVILGTWPAADQGERRARLLRPIAAQSDAVSEAIRRRVRVKDVDAETGVELDDDGEADQPEG
jgi:hypothetical protein